MNSDIGTTTFAISHTASLWYANTRILAAAAAH